MIHIEHLKVGKIDWEPLVSTMQEVEGKNIPTYPGNLKTALINHAGLSNNVQGEATYQLAVEISRLTTYSDLEIIYWFSRLVELIDLE